MSIFRVHHGREILRLATPTVLTMLSQSLMWTVDTALIGRVSSVALASVGLGGILTWTAYCLVNNLSRISNTFVSQAFGRNDDRAIGEYTWQGIYIAVVAGLFLQALGYFSSLMLPLTQNPPEVLAGTYVYIKWRTLSAVAQQLTFCIMGFFQGRRDVKTPMWAGIIGNLVNLVLDIWLIFGWSGFELGGHTWLAMQPLGVRGAAMATSAGIVVNFLVLAYWMFEPRRHRQRYRLHRLRRPDPRKLWDMIRVGTPAAWDSFIDMSGFMFLSIFIGRTGAVPLAASQITIQLLSFSFMPLWGLTIAGSVLTGNHIGAKQPEQARAYARQVYKLGAYYSLGLAAILVVLRHHLFAVFTNDPAVLALGAGLACTAAFFQFCDGVRMISVGIFQGAGDTRFPMLVSLVVLWGIFLPLTWYLMEVRDGNVLLAWMGGSFCYLLQAACLWGRFRSNRWLKVKIFSEDRATESS